GHLVAGPPLRRARRPAGRVVARAPAPRRTVGLRVPRQYLGSGARMAAPMRPGPLVSLCLAAATIAAVTGCGGGGEARADERLTVYAASSLREALPDLDPAPRYSFGSSGTLETQIRRGAPADVFLAASP